MKSGYGGAETACSLLRSRERSDRSGRRPLAPGVPSEEPDQAPSGNAVPIALDSVSKLVSDGSPRQPYRLIFYTRPARQRGRGLAREEG